MCSTPESGARAGYDGHKRTRGSKIHAAVDIDAMTSRAIHAFSQSNGHGRGPRMVIEKIELNIGADMDEATWRKRSDELMAQIMDKLADLVDQS